MYANPDRPGIIFIGDKRCHCYQRKNEKYNPDWICGIVSHETLHDVLNRMKLELASYGLDCIEAKHDSDTDVGICKSVLTRLGK